MQDTHSYPYWWTFSLRGLMALALGVYAFVLTTPEIRHLAVLMGAYGLIDAALTLLPAMRSRVVKKRFWLLEGALGVLAGVLLMGWNGITLDAVLNILFLWFAFKGLCQIVESGRIREEVPNDWLLMLGGIATAAFGISMAAARGMQVSLNSAPTLIAFYAVVFGCLFIVFGFRARIVPSFDYGHMGSAGARIKESA